MSIQIRPFQRRELAAIIDKQKPSPSFLRDTLLRGERFVASRILDLKTTYDARRLGIFVRPKDKAAFIKPVEFRAQAIMIPRLSQLRKLYVSDIKDHARMVYGSTESIQDAFEDLTLAELKHSRNRIERALEWLLGRFISTGSATLSGLEYTIGTLAVQTAHTAWSTSTTNIVSCINEMKRRVYARSGGEVEQVIGIYNHTVGTRLLNNPSYQNYFAANFVGQRNISKNLAPNVTFHGNIDGVDMYQYDEEFVDYSEPNDLVTQPIIPDNVFIVVAVTSSNIEYYTSAETMQALSRQEKIYVRQEMVYDEGLEVVDMVTEANALPYIDVDSITIASIT